MYRIHSARWIAPGIAMVGLMSLLVAPVRGEQWYGDPIDSDGPTGRNNVRVADLNNDGISDIVAEQPYTIFHLGQDGTANLEQVIEGGSLRPTFALIDENRDTYLDLICLAPNDSDLRVYRNDGTGHFYHALSPGVGDPPWAVRDINGDSYADLAGGSGIGVVIIWGGPTALIWSNPTFVDPCDYEIWECVQMEALDFIDLNQDNMLDAVVVGQRYVDDFIREPVIWWSLASAPGVFESSKRQIVGNASQNLRGVQGADLDLDGDPDLVCIGSTDAIFYYDSSSDLFVPGGRPFQVGGQSLPVRVKRIDGDEFYDAVGMDAYADPGGVKAVLFKGTGPGQFMAIQELIGAGPGDFASVWSDAGDDFVSVALVDRGYPVSAWPRLGDPAAAQEGNSLPDKPELEVEPSVARSSATLRLRMAIPTMVTYEVADVSGRVLRRLRSSARDVVWDLRDEHGATVPSGVYWIRASAMGDQGACRGRVVVCR